VSARVQDTEPERHTMTSIHSVKPREVDGRDMILRVNMQHQAAAYAALEILQGGEVDRVYCDYQDDFVVRRTKSGSTNYHFFQVKTKRKSNHLWSLNEVLAIKKRKQGTDSASLEAISKSFLGRLISLSIIFGDSCWAASLLTNVYFDDEVVATVAEFRAGSSTGAVASFLINNFCRIFNALPDAKKAVAVLAKLAIEPGVRYIGDEQREFAVAAREQIYRFSEIDLEHHEMVEIATGLVSLVNGKSIANLSGAKPEELDDLVGVGITDLLGVLSISPNAYEALKNGGDPKFLKTASFLQRKLKAAGATDSMIEFAAQKKVAWDVWMRDARHIYPEFDLIFLLDATEGLRGSWMLMGGEMKLLQQILDREIGTLIGKFPTLTKELLFGGVISAYVRRGTI
jgi:hypothetical protein